jgi:hypothetical protein
MTLAIFVIAQLHELAVGRQQQYRGGRVWEGQKHMHVVQSNRRVSVPRYRGRMVARVDIISIRLRLNRGLSGSAASQAMRRAPDCRVAGRHQLAQEVAPVDDGVLPIPGSQCRMHSVHDLVRPNAPY